MDDIQQKYYDPSDQQRQSSKKNKGKSIYKKPDKQKKMNQIQAYQQALKNHRKSCFRYFNPFSQKQKQKQFQLNIEKQNMINSLQQARDCQKDVPAALRSIGLKRVKILFKCGAVQHFQSVIDYLTSRKIPQWMKMKHQELLNKKY